MTGPAPSTRREPIRFAYWVPNVSGGLVIRPKDRSAGRDNINGGSVGLDGGRLKSILT
jgi:hypothetical protein